MSGNLSGAFLVPVKW